jgi:heterogeneous nuclear ribonucleoprotein R
MSARQRSEEKEQLDLEGDDDVMDDDTGYRRHRCDDSEEPLEDDENEDRDGHGEDDAEMTVESEEPTAGDNGGGEIGKRGPQGPEDEEERKKWDELLTLPPHGSEVFIGGLPRDITEENLLLD